MTGTSKTRSWGPQERPVSMRGAKSLSGFLSSQSLSLVPHLELRQKPQYSSPELTWISGFLWSFNRGVTPRLMWRHGCLLSSRAVKVVSGFLSSWHRDLWLSLEVPQGCHISHCVLSQYLRWQLSHCKGIRFIWNGLGHHTCPVFLASFRDEGPFPCFVGKGILAFSLHLNRRQCHLDTWEELQGSCHNWKRPQYPHLSGSSPSGSRVIWSGDRVYD